MTAPAPYTRETLERIRKGANADHLGWQEDRYRTICRHHGIEPRASAVAAKSAAPLVTEGPKIRKNYDPNTPRFKALRQQIVGNDLIDVYSNLRLSKRGRALLTDQAEALGLSMMGMLTLIAETAARQDICGLIIGIPEDSE